KGRDSSGGTTVLGPGDPKRVFSCDIYYVTTEGLFLQTFFYMSIIISMKLLPLKIAAFLLFVALGGYGQQSVKIVGILIDSLTHEPIPYATVALLSQQAKAPVKGAQTDTSGHLNLGTLLMTASKNNILKEVVVAGKKLAFENVDGKKVFSVNQSLVSKGGNAADLLQNIPTLQIDGNGNVNLRGSSNVNVLIDGKPTIIANGNLARILQSIPAASIESIEVIPNPPASYEANGEGIVNIILKKNSRPGLNGSADIAGGTRGNFNADASLS